MDNIETFTNLRLKDEIFFLEFLQERLGFFEMGEVVSDTLDRLGRTTIESLEHVLEVDREARVLCGESIRVLQGKESKKKS